MRNRLKSFYWLASLVWLIGQLSCIPQSDLNNIVVTEDVLYISGERVRLSGRVVEIDGKVDDHGFYISTSEDFSSPITITLGPKENGLGRFIGEYYLLDVNTSYYYKSYANVNGQEFTGQPKLFSSLAPQINSFYPDNGVPGNIMTITGSNITQDVSVFIGDILAEIVNVDDETLVEVRIPDMGDVFEVKVKVVVQDTAMAFEKSFTYHTGYWELETTFFNNIQLYETMWLYEGNEFIFGLGREFDFTLNLDIWSLDLATKQWADLNFAGGTPTRAPFNANGYWGSGAKSEVFSSSELTDIFWQYSSGTFTLMPPLPFKLFKSVGLELNGDTYVFGGNTHVFATSPSAIIYRFKIATNSWELISETPITINSDSPYFKYNDEAYFLQPDGAIWRFSPDTEKWDIVSYYPEVVGELGVALTLNNKAYIGLFKDKTRLYEWDILNDKWINKNAFAGSFRDSNIAFFSHENKLYFFRSKAKGGQYVLDPKMELWSLNPAQLN